MPKHANIDKIHLKVILMSNVIIELAQVINVPIKDRSLIKTKKVPCKEWTNHYQNHGYMS